MRVRSPPVGSRGREASFDQKPKKRRKRKERRRSKGGMEGGREVGSSRLSAWERR